MVKKSSKGELRIIAGLWRGRKITFSEVDGLRPTSSRIRETLFNWLAPIIKDASCLDLFAGSGALGFEALSRGANFVTMVESHLKVSHQLKQVRKSLNIENLQIINQDAFQPLALPLNTPQSFDVVFCDPPFNQGLVPPLLKLLNDSNYLSPNALVYVETEKKHTNLDIPASWTLIKDKKAGDVKYMLFKVS